MRIARNAGAPAAVAVLTAALLTACGSDDSSSLAQDLAPSSPSMSATSGANPPQGPTCGHVWRDGRALPSDYRGCATAGGWVKAQVYQCSDGHRMVTYAHVFYASPGRTISRAATTLAKDPDFRQTMAVCGA